MIESFCEAGERIYSGRQLNDSHTRWVPFPSLLRRASPPITNPTVKVTQLSFCSSSCLLLANHLTVFSSRILWFQYPGGFSHMNLRTLTMPACIPMVGGPCRHDAFGWCLGAVAADEGFGTAITCADAGSRGTVPSLHMELVFLHSNLRWNDFKFIFVDWPVSYTSNSCILAYTIAQQIIAAQKAETAALRDTIASLNGVFLHWPYFYAIIHSLPNPSLPLPPLDANCSSYHAHSLPNLTPSHPHTLASSHRSTAAVWAGSGGAAPQGDTGSGQNLPSLHKNCEIQHICTTNHNCPHIYARLFSPHCARAWVGTDGLSTSVRLFESLNYFFAPHNKHALLSSTTATSTAGDCWGGRAPQARSIRIERPGRADILTPWLVMRILRTISPNTLHVIVLDHLYSIMWRNGTYNQKWNQEHAVHLSLRMTTTVNTCPYDSTATSDRIVPGRTHPLQRAPGSYVRVTDPWVASLVTK